ncbi:DUF2480 family protein [Bernardetia sp.]|uniref:DUF2480 family protein n=1 Tax=Bernardetia sp. TaxID=1937974 RepID=UPI0025C15F59|nr:DUF2480 family protein [Bernardetia sp.]
MEKNTIEKPLNKITNSSIITFDLEEIYPEGERIEYDIKQNLFQELILREKDFRAFVKQYDWSQYQGKFVNVVCSADAIVPMWAFMVIVSNIEPYAKKVVIGTKSELESELYRDIFNTYDWQQFLDKKVVIKGCSKIKIPNFVYGEATRRLAPIAKLIMFGEACSSVPVYKKPKISVSSNQ